MTKKKPYGASSDERYPGSQKYIPKYTAAKNTKTLKLLKERKINSIAGLAIELGVAKSTVYEWVKHYPKFAYTLSMVKTYLEDRVYTQVNSGGNATFGIFNLTNNYGYMTEVDKQKLKQKERELDARINGDISDEKEIVIQFTDAVNPKDDADDADDTITE